MLEKSPNMKPLLTKEQEEEARKQAIRNASATADDLRMFNNLSAVKDL